MEIGAAINLFWREKGSFYYKKMAKDKIDKDFSDFVKGYPDNNEVSKQIVECIEFTSEFYIDWDSSLEIQKLFYYVPNLKIANSIDIIYHHKIVLAKLKEYCTDGEELSYKEAEELSNIF